MDTLEYNFNVKIDHYVLVDFDMFKSIVNKLGGITVEVTEKRQNTCATTSIWISRPVRP